MKFGNCEKEFLFDTGSEVNLLNKIDYEMIIKDIQGKKLCKYNKTLCGVNGIELKIEGKVKMQVEFCKQLHELTFIILDEKDVAIIGMAGMEKMKVIIDAEKRTIQSNETKLIFKAKKAEVSTVKEEKPNLFLANDAIIPAKKRRIVNGIVKGMLPTTKESLVDLTYSSKRYGLILPDQVVNTGESIPIAIFNCNDYPIRLKRNSTMGTVSEVVIEEENVVTMASDEGKEIPPDNHPLNLVKLDHLNDEQRSKMETLLLKHHEVFSRHKYDIGKCPVQSHPIKMKEGT